jgi:hypothetical protein
MSPSSHARDAAGRSALETRDAGGKHGLALASITGVLSMTARVGSACAVTSRGLD